jgi:hypothetical protein
MGRKKLTDEYLDALDPYAPCKPKKNRTKPGRPKCEAHDQATCLHAACRDDYWLAAAAFGAGDVDQSGNVEVTYLDAIMALAASPPKEDRRGMVRRE